MGLKRWSPAAAQLILMPTAICDFNTAAHLAACCLLSLPACCFCKCSSQFIDTCSGHPHLHVPAHASRMSPLQAIARGGPVFELLMALLCTCHFVPSASCSGDAILGWWSAGRAGTKMGRGAHAQKIAKSNLLCLFGVFINITGLFGHLSQTNREF